MAELKARTDCRACSGQSTCVPAVVRYWDGDASSNVWVAQGRMAEDGGLPRILAVKDARPFQLYICETCGTVRGEKR